MQPFVQTIPEKAFYIPEVDDTVELYTKRGLVKEIINRVPDILHSFISDLQAACPTPDCLEKKVPGLTEYHERLKYLQMDVPPKTLLTENNMSLKIMIALRDIDNIILDCRKEVLEAKRKQLEKQKQLEKEQQAESSKQ